MSGPSPASSRQSELPPAQATVQIAAPPNTPFVVQESRCLKEPCLICMLQKAVTQTASTMDVTFSTVPLRLNIVGVRSEDSLSNRFDDVMAVFFQLLPPDSKEAFDKALEADLLEDMRACVEALGKSSMGGFRQVACSVKGLWVVGLFTVTTDPGFEDSPEALEAQRARYEEQLKAARQRAGELEPREGALRVAQDKAKKAQAALLAKRKKGVAPLAPELPEAVDDLPAPIRDRASLGQFIAAVQKRLDALTAARRTQETHPGLIVQKETALERKTWENEVRKGHLPTFQYHKGWVEQGRAIVPVGHYPDAYRFYLHKAGSPEGFPRATVALAVPFIAKGMRIYSVKHLCTAPEKKLGRDFVNRSKANDGATPYVSRELCQLWPLSEPVRRFSPGEALLELTDLEPADGEQARVGGGASREVFLVERKGSTRTRLEWGDRVVIADVINGTNIHRAHNATLSPDRTRLQGRTAQDGVEVNSWSEGCQTFTDFDEFNAFIRMCAVSKRWLCANGDPACVGRDACKRLLAGPGQSVVSEADLRCGENELLSWFKEPYVHRALAESCSKVASDIEPRLESARTERDSLALTDEEAGQLLALQERKDRVLAKSPRTAHPGIKPLGPREEAALALLVQKADRARTPDVAARIQELDALIQELSARRAAWSAHEVDALNEVRLEALPMEIKQADVQVEKLEQAVNALQGQLDAVPKKGEKALSKGQRRLIEQRQEKLKEQLNEARGECELLKKEQHEREKTRGLEATTLQRRREFLRERAQTFQADYLRSCDLSGLCKTRFSYTLMELPAADVEAMKRRMRESHQGPWNGEWSMGLKCDVSASDSEGRE